MSKTEKEFKELSSQLSSRIMEDHVSPLIDKVERLNLVCQAMWSLLSEKTNITEEELRARIDEIDLIDGKLDGKVEHPPIHCTHCQRVIPRKMKQCLYCTVPAPLRNVWEP